MSEKYFVECKHFRQHYTFDQRKIFRIHCGHCTMHKAKRKKPDSKACDFFVLSPPQDQAFVSKEYLSKELLQYVLRLELLPEIEDNE